MIKPCIGEAKYFSFIHQLQPIKRSPALAKLTGVGAIDIDKLCNYSEITPSVFISENLKALIKSCLL